MDHLQHRTAQDDTRPRAGQTRKPLLLRRIPGVDLVVLDSQCCGIAGTYGFKKENYDVSQSIGAPLFKQIGEVDPDVVVTDCETCKWQIEMSTPYRVMNPISIINDAILD